MEGIYRLTFPNNEIYIGKSNDIEYRWSQYKSGKVEKQPLLHKALQEYSFDSVKKEVLFESYNLDVHEKHYIKLYENSGAKLLNVQYTKNKKRTKKCNTEIRIESFINKRIKNHIKDEIIYQCDVFTGDVINTFKTNKEAYHKIGEKQLLHGYLYDSYTPGHLKSGRFHFLGNYFLTTSESARDAFKDHIDYLNSNNVLYDFIEEFSKRSMYLNAFDQLRFDYLLLPIDKMMQLFPDHINFKKYDDPYDKRYPKSIYTRWKFNRNDIDICISFHNKSVLYISIGGN